MVGNPDVHCLPTYTPFPVAGQAGYHWASKTDAYTPKCRRIQCMYKDKKVNDNKDDCVTSHYSVSQVA